MSNAKVAGALRALGRRKTANKARIVSGKAPIIGGKKVSPDIFKKKTGESISEVKKRAARESK